MKMTRQQFEESVVAQDDDNDYSESGYVAGVFNGVAYIASYGHYSCYGTFDDLCGGGISDTFSEGNAAMSWTGTPDEMVAMARRMADPDMPEREADKSDYHYDHLQSVYAEIVAWDERGRK